MDYDPETYNENFDPDLVQDAVEWKQENSWYDSDPVLRAAANQLDQKLEAQGVPTGWERFNYVSTRLRAAYPQHFYEHPEPKKTWNSIIDPAERAEAKKGFEQMKERFKYSGKKVTEADYLEDYFS